MKGMVIFVVLLILISNVAFAKDVAIPETFEDVGSGETTYFYAGSKLVASKNDDEVTYHYQDRLGSDVDSKSLPFGQLLKEGERFSFTGKELDSELHYFNARYYDSSIGRFTSVDPVEGELAYGYVMNNPMNYVDPTGMSIRGGQVDIFDTGIGDVEIAQQRSFYSDGSWWKVWEHGSAMVANAGVFVLNAAALGKGGADIIANQVLQMDEFDREAGSAALFMGAYQFSMLQRGASFSGVRAGVTTSALRNTLTSGREGLMQLKNIF
ncbi:RHS repeat-associated core domain-containing protein [Candidatus Woesearchaeota archaeon]|jgi:RHS repeat-associated protein|nr:RHS repeat-associated core domain-containing protein [Candidatus Woesearchaeota archaeon]MBT7237536.1 RHS repeat-associated core domain-containing protein [Candidatus Woesearchaeota archaeon]